MSEARIWYGRNLDQPNLPGDCRNMIVLTPEFYQEVTSHPIPTDLQAAKALSCAPAALDLFTWLSYRCFLAKGEERIPLFRGLRSGQPIGKWRISSAAESSENVWTTGWTSEDPVALVSRTDQRDGMRLIVRPAAAMGVPGGDNDFA